MKIFVTVLLLLYPVSCYLNLTRVHVSYDVGQEFSKAELEMVEDMIADSESKKNAIFLNSMNLADYRFPCTTYGLSDIMYDKARDLHRDVTTITTRHSKSGLRGNWTQGKLPHGKLA